MTILGPVPCQGCRRLVWYAKSISETQRIGHYGARWRERDGQLHRCPAVVS